MRLPKVLPSLLFLVLQAACNRSGSTAPDTPVDPAPSGLVGTWLLESGAMMEDFIGGTATFDLVTTDVTAIRIGDDGTGDVWLRDRLTGARDHVRAFVVFDDDDNTLVFDFAAETTPDFEFNAAVNRDTFVFPVVALESNTIRIAGEAGRVALLTRSSALSDTVTLGQLDVVDRFDGLPAPEFFSDLVPFDGDLLYSTSTQIERFSPVTHTLGPPLGATMSRIVQASQDDTFWTHCACGGSPDAIRQTPTEVVDTVSSADEMGGPITFRAMEYLPTTDRLWLHGRPFSNQVGTFFVVDTSGEPDVVDRQIAFNRDVRALAFDGTDLWAVVTVATQAVVRIDPASGTVLASYEVPDPDVSWAGLAFATDGMYMLGKGEEGEGVIVRVTPPA